VKQLVLVLIALALPPAVYFPTFGERREKQRRELERTIDDRTLHIEQDRAAQRKYTQFREEMQRLDVENEKLRRILPPSFAIGDIATTVQSYATENGIRVERFDARKPVAEKGDPYSFVKIDVQVTGNATATSAFLRRLSNSSQIFNVDATTMRKDPAGWRTDFVMTAYAMPD
jgi:Tfp pilus assembly protein PilO